jgi:D-galactarolactone cycloisomerase
MGSEFFSPRGSELLRLLESTLRAIRATVGDDFVIGVDGHMGGIPDPITREEALDVARVLGTFGVNFFEEPLSYLDPAGYAWLRERSPVRISGGESLALRAGFEAFVGIGALDILQPDTNFVGGLGQGMAIARLASEHGLAMIPHAWCAGPGFMANIHLALACEQVERLEMARELTDFQQASLVEKPVIRDGVLLAPTAPGLGIDFSPELIERFPFPAGLAERGSGLVTVPVQASS